MKGDVRIMGKYTLYMDEAPTSDTLGNCMQLPHTVTEEGGKFKVVVDLPMQLWLPYGKILSFHRHVASTDLRGGDLKNVVFDRRRVNICGDCGGSRMINRRLHAYSGVQGDFTYESDLCWCCK